MCMSVCTQVQCRMERALPVLAEAVASIVHHSTSRAFKERAMELLQVCMQMREISGGGYSDSINWDRL